MRWFGTIWLCCCAAQLAAGQEVVLKHLVNGIKIDKLAEVNGTVWAAGQGSIFIYTNTPHGSNPKGFKEAFRANNRGRVLALSALKDELTPTLNVAIVCFEQQQGLCEVYDTLRNQSYPLNEKRPINHAGPGSLLSLLQHHAKGSPLLFATNQNTTAVNEIPLHLVELHLDDYLKKVANDSFELNLFPYKGNKSARSEMYSLSFRGRTSRISPPIHYIYSFQRNGFVYIVTVQPGLEASLKVSFQTRIARFCLNDSSMTTYTEVPVRCEIYSTIFDLAVQARAVQYENEYLLLISMGRSDKSGRYPDPSKESAICAFNVDKLSNMFNERINECNDEGNEYGVRKLKYYQKNSETGFLRCEYSHTVDSCAANQKNKYIVSMIEFSGDSVFSTQAEHLHYPTYIYNKTRTTSASVGVLTAFEVHPMKSASNTRWLLIWAADHLGQLHQILAYKMNGVFKSLLLMTVERPVAENGFAIESIQFNGSSMFVIDNELFSAGTEDICAAYKNCGDCLNPYRLSDEIISCAWIAGRCVAKSPPESQVCEPSVTEAGPFRGPEKGGTQFKIKGFDLGRGQDTKSIRFGTHECKIDKSSSLSVICEVPPKRPADKAQVNVTLNVVDQREDERLQTYSVRSSSPQLLGTYTYYKVEFYGVYPSFGPKIGGTPLRLVGENIGRLGHNTRYGLFGGDDRLICKEFIVRNDAELLCNTTEYLYPKIGEKEAFNLSLKIGAFSYDAVSKLDQSEIFFYQPNPSKITFSPLTKENFYINGSRSYPIIFTGENLDAGAFPKLIVELPGVSYPVSAPCIANFSVISCRAPSLVGLNFLKRAVSASLTLQIDNFKFDERSRIITYYPSFELLLKDEETFLVDPSGPSKFTIRGRNLLPLDKDDVKIKFGDKPCEIEAIEENGIECSAEMLTDAKYDVEVDVFGTKYTAFRCSVITIAKGSGWALAAGIVIGSLMIVTALVLIAVRFGYFRKKVSSFSEPKVTYTPKNDGYLHPDNERLLTSLPPDPELINQLSEEGLLMDFSLIQVGALIGKGQFGCVYHGILKRDKLSVEEQVAVKMLQQRGYTSNDITVFLKEALRMKDFNHQNVLKLIGVSFDNNKSSDPMIIVPYMANGDLLTYIRDQNNMPTVKDLITFGANIALGMAYLTTQRFVHRDLAARNCMLGVDLIVRVADFGLSRDVYETSYYSSDNSKTKLPVKWMAIESLVEGVYSHKSDVWSYGVVLWELMTRGCVPYPNVDNWDVHKWLKAGRRMLQPNFCPDALYKIMMACWDEDPKKRPTFSELVKDVPNVIHTIEMTSRNQVPSYVNV